MMIARGRHLARRPWGRPPFLGWVAAFALLALLISGGSVALAGPLNQPPTADPNGPYLFPLDAGPFDGSGSFDPDGDPLTYDWDYGDGNVDADAGATPSHTYAEAGIYQVCLTVDDGNEGIGVACTDAVIFDPSAGFVTGGGWIASPEGAYYPSDLVFFDSSYYEMVSWAVGWVEARELAEGLSYRTCESAHLGTITSQGEYDAAEMVLAETEPFAAALGGYQDEGVSPPDAGWKWVTGEPFDFELTSNLGWWQPDEPNDCAPHPDDECVLGSEQMLTMYAGGGLEGWNDEPMATGGTPYLIEYEGCDPEPTGKATFGFVSKYNKGATVPTGNTEFQFQAASFDFHSSEYQWLVVTGSDYAKLKGVGTINGQGEYKFQLWAGDGDPDTFRIKIYTEDEFGVETVIYDNGMDQPIGGGSIMVHTKRK